MKKQPPKYRFIAVFALAILLIVLVTLVLNSLGLKSYYEQQKIRSMQEAYRKIDEAAAEADYSVMENVLGDYSESDNLSIAVYDSYTTMVLVSSERDNEFLLQRLRDRLFANGDTDADVLVEEKNYSITRGKTGIEFFGYCSDNRVMVLMSTPLESSVVL